jgi:hypothetical protein
VDSINFLISMKNPFHPPPQVQLYGYPLTAEQVGSYPFMKFGFIKEPVSDTERNQTNAPRVRMVILIRRPQTPNGTATFLDLDALLFSQPYRILTVERMLSHFSPQPVPEHVIKAWNENIKQKKDYVGPTFVYRNAEVKDPPLEDIPAVPITGVQQAAEVPANDDDHEQMNSNSVQATEQPAVPRGRTRRGQSNLLNPLLLRPPSKTGNPDHSAVDADVRGQIERFGLDPDMKLRPKGARAPLPPKLQAEPPNQKSKVYQPLPKSRGGNKANSKPKAKTKSDISYLTCAIAGYGSNIVPVKAAGPKACLDDMDIDTTASVPKSVERNKELALGVIVDDYIS